MSEGNTSAEKTGSSVAASPLASARPRRLSLSLLGGVSLQCNGRELIIQNRKAKALLGYLALTANARDTRERIVGLLWSETEEGNARASLRQVLHMLREAFESAGFEGFSTARVDVVLDQDTVQVDVAAVLASAASGRPHRLLLDTPHIDETLLAGFDDLDPSFRSWLAVQRENLRQKLIRALEGRLAETAQEPRTTQAVAEALFQLDQTHEAACRRLIQCRVELGDTAGALSAYRRLWDLLSAEYDTEPSEETQALIAAIKTGAYRPAPPAVEAGPVRSPVALADAGAASAEKLRASRPALPKLALTLGRFDLEGISEENRHVAVAFRFDLMSKLVRFREWALIDGEMLPIPLHKIAIAQPLYLLSVKFFAGFSQPNFSMVLQAVETGQVVWSERFGLGAEDFFGAQQAILHRIAGALNVNLSIERLNRLASMPDVSLEIYDRWLRGQMLGMSFRDDARPRSVQMFESIVADAPGFAPAYSSLAQVENSNHIVYAGTYRTAQTQQRAIMLAKTAVGLDPLDSRAQLCLGWAYAMNGGFDLAEFHFRQARELNEGDPWTLTSAAQGLAFCDQKAEALELADFALASVPFPSPLQWQYQCQTRFVCEDYAGSLAAAERVGGAIPYCGAWHAAALAQTGRAAEAAAEIRRFIGVIEKNWHGAAADPPELNTRPPWRWDHRHGGNNT